MAGLAHAAVDAAFLDAPARAALHDEITAYTDGWAAQAAQASP